MSKSLKKSFDQLTDNDWLHAGYAKLYTGLVGNKSEDIIAADSIKSLVSYTESVSGAIYIFNDEKLQLSGTYGLDMQTQKYFLREKVISGKYFLDREPKALHNLNATDYVVSFANGKIGVQHILFTNAG
jgi:hypothetical protein